MCRAKRKGRLQAVEPGVDHGEREGGPGDVRVRPAVGTHPKEGDHLPGEFIDAVNHRNAFIRR